MIGGILFLVLLIALISYKDIAALITDIFREPTKEELDELDELDRQAEWRADFEERWKKSQENTKDRNS